MIHLPDLRHLAKILEFIKTILGSLKYILHIPRFILILFQLIL